MLVVYSCSIDREQSFDKPPRHYISLISRNLIFLPRLHLSFQVVDTAKEHTDVAVDKAKEAATKALDSGAAQKIKDAAGNNAAVNSAVDKATTAVKEADTTAVKKDVNEKLDALKQAAA